MPRFIKILCPVDFDKNSLAAIRVAGELAAEEREATLDILHVVPIPPGPEVAIPFDQLEGRVRTKLLRLIRSRINSKIRHTVHIKAGDPAAEVVCMAEQAGSDLIVLATHGRKGLTRLLLGSVAEQIVRGAPCSVLITRPGISRPKPRATRASAWARAAG
jgi:nucleotide-binding universal stress UspA family protein